MTPLTPEQKAAAHERGLLAKAEREARENQQKPLAAREGIDYARFRSIGLSHEEAVNELEKRRVAEQRYAEERGTLGFSSGSGVFIGPRGGRYRITGRGRKSYDIP